MVSATTAAVATEALRFRYAVAGGESSAFALGIPDFSLAFGHTMVCIGPSGSGKSTLLHLLAGILQPQSGRVIVGDVELSALSEAARRNFRISNIGLVFQSFELLEHLSVRENILLPFFVNRSLELGAEAESALAELAEVTGIAPHLRKRPRQLSQGERQRVALCRALVTRPSLLLADEPTGNLDPDNTENVLQILMEEVRRRGTTLIMVTHDHGLVHAFDAVLDFRDLTVSEPTAS